MSSTIVLSRPTLRPYDEDRTESQPCVSRSRTYRFVLDTRGMPIELGSGRFAKAYLGEECWLESKTAFRRKIAIKILQSGVSPEDVLRFQLEKELIERAQGHPNIVKLHASGEADNPGFIPPSLRDRVDNDFILLELCDLSLEERLKGSRRHGVREDLLAYPAKERVVRVLEYMLPITAAIEYSHLVKGICHRDIKPANVLLKLPDPKLQGATLEVRLADFNVAKLREDEEDPSLTLVQGVPGTQFFQSPEQETNIIEVLASVTAGSNEVEFFEDFYISIRKNDVFQVFNRPERYIVAGVDAAKKRILLTAPFRETSEEAVRAKIVKSVDRPADIYSLGAMFYYLVSGGYSNPKSLYDSFHKFQEYETDDEHNTIAAYLEHEYRVIQSLRSSAASGGTKTVVPVDRFFSYKHYVDGNGELIDQEIMYVVIRAMIRNKPDSYCQSWDVSTAGISELMADLVRLSALHGGGGWGARSTIGTAKRRATFGLFRRMWNALRRRRPLGLRP